ncbi:Maf family protein [Ilumatobacter coccineus]|uniref:dTTP/UTP pyrophosphatase n=1 Tax=Ilumatobacter coccineus (strain NBRC 103263 / KCTC 29153 / YM16-304) TaxID=1313172 RepID=A0A6C7E3G6_ILUCY|nr:Maf family protein [Ilumatobacter coccineus]BAN01213.1 Maf-like protein [Ilumatobacter coccineus YM16-304]
MIELPDGVELVLASASPRRRELLAGAGLDFAVVPADIDETPLPGECPADYVARLSAQKAQAVAQPGQIVIAADTTVEVDGAILEKPVDRADARRMLRLLSGRAHRCHTGVSVRSALAGEPTLATQVVTTEVVFVELTDVMIDWYLDTGEADDKAGAYGIQGAAGAFVERVEGSVTNVIGLPLAETLAMLANG